MIVMLGGCSNAFWHYCAGRYPGRVGYLTAPSYFAPSHTVPWMEFACDNGKFPIWSRGGEWDEGLFFRMLDRIKALNRKPRFVVVPDEVGNLEETNRNWDKYSERVRRYGFPIAYACQDGCQSVPEEADVAFIGGTDEWKWRNIEKFCKEHMHVHVGRVGNLDRIWMCYDYGAESVDSTGFFRDGADAWRILKLESFFRNERPAQRPLEY